MSNSFPPASIAVNTEAIIDECEVAEMTPQSDPSVPVRIILYMTLSLAFLSHCYATFSISSRRLWNWLPCCMWETTFKHDTVGVVTAMPRHPPSRLPSKNGGIWDGPWWSLICHACGRFSIIFKPTAVLNRLTCSPVWERTRKKLERPSVVPCFPNWPHCGTNSNNQMRFFWDCHAVNGSYFSSNIVRDWWLMHPNSGGLHQRILSPFWKEPLWRPNLCTEDILFSSHADVTIVTVIPQQPK